jgi:hypothetical protein
MPICTATDVTVYTDISCSAGTIVSSGLIGIVQARINSICNNYFLTDMDFQGQVVFGATAGTLTITANWDDYGFLADDEIYIYNSYRNDGYKIVGSVTTTVLTLASGSSCVSELSGRTVLVTVAKWPDELKYIAAQMIKYDYDDRPNKEAGVASKSLGPFSVSYNNPVSMRDTPFGYPAELVQGLESFTIVRLN